MTTDPTPIPDDADTSLRATREAYREHARELVDDAERRVQAVRDEHAALVAELAAERALRVAREVEMEGTRQELREAQAEVAWLRKGQLA